MASMRSSSDDETSNLSAPHHPSRDVSGDTLYWDDLLPTGPCLSGDPWVHRFDDNIWSGDLEEIAVANGEPDPDSQSPPPEGAELISNIPPPSPSKWNSSVDEDEFTSCDVSPLLVSELFLRRS
jgi:hypothetical protein